MGSIGRGNRHVLSNPFLRDVDLREEERASLSGIGFACRHYPPHMDIVREGYAIDRIYIIESGWGCVYKILADGERQIIDFPLGGDVIGLRGNRIPAQRTFMSLTELVVHEASAKAVFAAITGFERLIELFLGSESRHKFILAEHLTNLGHRSALARTAHLLLELGARLKYAGCADGESYECPLTQYDLADALGLTAIHVNRMLRELRERGLLSFQKGRVNIIDTAGLKNICDFSETYTLLS